MNKKIILCADDYAQNEAISEGIILLANLQRINAVSCMVTSPYWDKSSTQILTIQHNAFIGLHLNFTFGKALSMPWRRLYGENFFSLPQLIRKSYLRQLDAEATLAEIKAQLEHFIEKLGFMPDYIDGHQHVQQLPMIRDVLIAVNQQSNLTPFYRSTTNNWQEFFTLNNFPKRLGVSLLGGISFKNKLKQFKLPSNPSFAGIYSFKKAKNYRTYFKQFLKASASNGIIMCHPGMESSDKNDPLRPFRHLELNYFVSDSFWDDLNEESCCLLQKLEYNIG